MKQPFRLFLFAVAFLGVEILLIAFVDRPLSNFTRDLDTTHHGLIDFFRATTDYAKSKWYLWPSAFGILTCAAWLHLLDMAPETRRRIAMAGHKLAFFFLSIAVSGMAADFLKPIFGRARPVLLHDGTYGFHPLTFRAVMNGMPSGHATTAAALATALTLLLPRGRVLWLLVGAFLAFSRVMVNAHYLSDVLAGILVGSLTTLRLSRLRDNQGMFPLMHGIFPIDRRPSAS